MPSAMNPVREGCSNCTINSISRYITHAATCARFQYLLSANATPNAPHCHDYNRIGLYSNFPHTIREPGQGRHFLNGDSIFKPINIGP